MNCIIINFTWLNRHSQALCLSIWGFWGLISVDWGLQHWFLVGNVDFFLTEKMAWLHMSEFSLSLLTSKLKWKKIFELPLPQPKEKKKNKLIFRQHACISEFACKVEERMPHDAKTNLQNYSVFYNRKMPERKLNLLQLSCDNPPTAENPATLGDDQTNWFRSGHRWKQKDIHHSMDLIWEIFMVCSPEV